MKTFSLILYAVIAAAAAYILYRVLKLGESVGSAISTAGSKAAQAVTAAHQSVVNAVSTTFKSDAEKTVDDLYGPNQSWKKQSFVRPGEGTIHKPVDDASDTSPRGFLNPAWYDNSSVNDYRNNQPPQKNNLTGVAPVRNCDISGDCGNYPRVVGNTGGTLNPASNAPPQNNDTVFDVMVFPY